MRLITNTDIDRARWDDFLLASPWANPFQSVGFFDFFNTLPGLSAQAFAVENSQGLQALCVATIQKEPGLKGQFSRRAIIYGGPLLRAGADAALAFLLHAIHKRLSAKAIYLEVRNYHSYEAHHAVYQAAGWAYQPYLNLQLDLKGQSLEGLLAAMPYNRRREIKQTLKAGVTFEDCQDEQEVLALYQILQDLYQTRVKLPLPPANFFTALFHCDVARFFTVKHEGKVIGGSVCIVLPGKSIYTMYYCGLRGYGPKIFPTHLAVIAAMQHAVGSGMERFDFMGAGTPQEEYGVRDYKAKFGGQLVEHGRFLKITKPVLFSVGKLGLKLMAKLK